LNLPLSLKAFSSASQPRIAKKFNRLGTNSGGINLLFRQFKVVLFGLRFRVALRDCQNTCLRIIFKERFNKFNVAIYEPTEILVMKHETKKRGRRSLLRISELLLTDDVMKNKNKKNYQSTNAHTHTQMS